MKANKLKLFLMLTIFLGSFGLKDFSLSVDKAYGDEPEVEEMTNGQMQRQIVRLQFTLESKLPEFKRKVTELDKAITAAGTNKLKKALALEAKHKFLVDHFKSDGSLLGMVNKITRLDDRLPKDDRLSGKEINKLNELSTFLSIFRSDKYLANLNTEAKVALLEHVKSATNVNTGCDGSPGCINAKKKAKEDLDALRTRGNKSLEAFIWHSMLTEEDKLQSHFDDDKEFLMWNDNDNELVAQIRSDLRTWAYKAVDEYAKAALNKEEGGLSTPDADSPIHVGNYFDRMAQQRQLIALAGDPRNNKDTGSLGRIMTKARRKLNKAMEAKKPSAEKIKKLRRAYHEARLRFHTAEFSRDRMIDINRNVARLKRARAVVPAKRQQPQNPLSNMNFDDMLMMRMMEDFMSGDGDFFDFFLNGGRDRREEREPDYSQGNRFRARVGTWGRDGFTWDVGNDGPGSAWNLRGGYQPDQYRKNRRNRGFSPWGGGFGDPRANINGPRGRGNFNPFFQ